MTPQRWFVLIFAVFYGCSTAGLAGTGFTDSLSGQPVRLTITVLVLIGVAVMAGWVAMGVRSTRPAVDLNRVTVLGFTALHVIAAVATWPQISALILAALVFVLFLFTPSQQERLKKERLAQER